MSNSYIQPIDSTLSGATTPSQSGPRSDGNEGVLRILQSSGITGTSPSDCFVSYQGHSLSGEFYPSEEMQSVYSTAQTSQLDWVGEHKLKSLRSPVLHSRQGSLDFKLN